jgi:hypothetical protein
MIMLILRTALYGNDAWAVQGSAQIQFIISNKYAVMQV